MIQYRNHTQEAIIDNFFSAFKDRINSQFPSTPEIWIEVYDPMEVPPHMQSTIKFLNGSIDNPTQCYPQKECPVKDTLLYCKEIKDELGISDNEMSALLAHEVGHFIYQYSEPKPANEEETFCDDVAIALGLGDELKTALSKLLTICLLEQRKRVTQRIERIK